jgi:hypothetical protein
MKSNMGFTDKAIRVVLGIIFATLYFAGAVTGTFGIVLLVVAVIFLATSFINFCPLYAPFGLSTCKTKTSS